jgi:hypothetical protein
MIARSGRAWLFTSLLLAAACDDLSLRRPVESAPADTIPDPEISSLAKETRGPKSRAAPGMTEAAKFSAIRRSLRRLVVAEATFFAENGTYSDDLSLIGFRPDNNTSIRFFWLSREGWAASGMYTGLDGKDCVVFVGQASAPPTTLKYVRSGEEGVPICDDRSPPRPVTAAPPPAEAPAPEPANPLDVMDPRVVMKVDLRNLAHSQETYFAMQGVYARRTQSLALQYLWHRGVRIEILTADAQSWSAKATHTRFPGKSCVIWFGPVPQRPTTDALKRQHREAAEPVCDD